MASCKILIDKVFRIDLVGNLSGSLETGWKLYFLVI